MDRAALLIRLVTIFSLIAAQSAGAKPVAAAAQQGKERRGGIERHVSKHDRLSFDAGEVARRVRRGERLTLAGANGQFEVELAAHDLRAARYAAVDVTDDGAVATDRAAADDDVITFRGKVVGTDDEARFTLDGRKVEGLIVAGGEKFFVEPLKRYEEGASAETHVMYKGSDVYRDGDEDGCGVTLEHKLEHAQEELSVPPPAVGEATVQDEAAPLNAYKEVELATDADYEFVTAYGGAAGANNEILSVLNQIEGIYKAELNLSFKVVNQNTWSTAADPYNQEKSDLLLGEFRSYWQANRGNVARDLTHLWTGKDIYSEDAQGNRSYSNAGVAYIGVTCRNSAYGYGLTERRTNADAKVRIPAHEMGHNFGATHQTGAACDNTIMSAVGTNSTRSTFCQASRDEVAAHVSTYGGCLAVATNNANPTVEFSAAAYSVRENASSAVVTVTRGGNITAPLSVDYVTSDQSQFVNCATATGLASARCDYSTSIDTLRFAAGEPSKTIAVPLVDDAHVEGNENLHVTLGNPAGGALGAQGAAVITILDDDAAGAPNKIDQTEFFVRQQYLDFLSREPEQPGYGNWTSTLNNCSNVNENKDCDRTHVSSAFFISDEFQFKGYFVYRFYQVSFGRLPRYDEMVADMRAVTGQTGEEVVQKKAAFADAWVNRAEFKQNFPDSLAPLDFVNRLERTVAVTLANKAQLIAELTAGARTRAQVVRAAVESGEVEAKLRDEAFVAMQYFGYLRRDPEPQGFGNWVNTIKANPDDKRKMVKGFIDSVEYRGRFGR